MHAVFGLQPAVGVVALDLDGRRLDARGLALGLFEQLDLVAVLLGPARVHAKQHAGPVLALGAAGAGVHLEIGVVAVGLARQQRLELAARGLGLELLAAPSSASATTPWSFSASPSSIMVTWSSSSRSIRPMALSWSSSAVRSCITRWARAVSFQSVGSSACAFSSARRALALSKSKMPPQQSDRPLDVLDQLFGFGAHDYFRWPAGFNGWRPRTQHAFAPACPGPSDHGNAGSPPGRCGP